MLDIKRTLYLMSARVAGTLTIEENDEYLETLSLIQSSDADKFASISHVLSAFPEFEVWREFVASSPF